MGTMHPDPRSPARLPLSAAACAAALLATGCLGGARPERHRAGAPAVARDALLDGRRVRYLDAGGGGRPIVLVHGWASDHRSWADLLEPWSRTRRVLAVDLPGHGQSEEPARPYDMDLFADAIAAVLDAAGVRDAVLVGHSNGTPAVRQFYRRYPERTAGLVLVDGPLRQMVDAESAAPFLEAFRSEGWKDRVAGFVDSMPASGLSPEQVAAIREMATSQPQHAVVGGLEAAIDASIWGEDPIDVPALVLLAEQPSWTPAYEAHVRRLVPDVEYVTWSGVSHYLMVERPEAFREIVEAFLQRIGW